MKCEECTKHEGLERRIQVLEDDVKELFKLTDKSSIFQADITANFNYLKITLEEVKGAIKELKESPSKRWDSIAVGSIIGILTAIATFILPKIIK